MAGSGEVKRKKGRSNSWARRERVVAAGGGAGLRLKHAVRLLKETRIKTAAVAEESGLGNYIQLHRLIKRHLGMSPGALRKSAT